MRHPWYSPGTGRLITDGGLRHQRRCTRCGICIAGSAAKRDSTPSVDEPALPAPAVRDDTTDAPGVPTVVTPLVFSTLAGHDPVAVPGTHQTVLLPRQSPAIDAAEGQRATVNPLSTTRIQSYSDTAAYVTLPIALGNVLAKSVVKEGPVAPRARVRGMRGRSY